MAGRRFETTMARDMERVASRLHEVDDRKTVCEKLRERKLGNTRTFIVFGFDEMNYQTDAQSRQKDILRKQDRGGAIDGKAMKKTLTATHFVLGNDDVKWTTNATQEDPTGRMHEFIGVLNADTTKKSSCYFGSDEMTYRTTARDSTSRRRRSPKPPRPRSAPRSPRRAWRSGPSPCGRRRRRRTAPRRPSRGSTTRSSQGSTRERNS